MSEPKRIVQDENEREIKLGTKVLYGSPETPEEMRKQIAEVIEISEPDVLYNPVTDSDDGGYALDVTIRFDDGETEKIQVHCKSSGWYGDDEEIFQEGGDLEVVLD